MTTLLQFSSGRSAWVEVTDAPVHAWLLIHGWGMNPGLFHSLAIQLSQHRPCYALELPGHGLTPPTHQTFDQLVGQLVQQLQSLSVERLYLVGWSMGGLLATALASRLSQIQNLILITNTPRFLEAEGWLGMPRQRAEKFTQEMLVDPTVTIQRFLALQFFQESNARELTRQAMNWLRVRGLPSREGLQMGINWLFDQDHRITLSHLTQSVLAVFARRDTLINYRSMQQINALNPQIRSLLLPTGHVPFFMHPEAFAHQLISFVNA